MSGIKEIYTHGDICDYDIEFSVVVSSADLKTIADKELRKIAWHALNDGKSPQGANIKAAFNNSVNTLEGAQSQSQLKKYRGKHRSHLKGRGALHNIGKTAWEIKKQKKYKKK